MATGTPPPVLRFLPYDIAGGCGRYNHLKMGFQKKAVIFDLLAKLVTTPERLAPDIASADIPRSPASA